MGRLRDEEDLSRDLEQKQRDLEVEVRRMEEAEIALQGESKHLEGLQE